MKIEISSKNYNVSDKLEDIITKKIEKLDRYFSDNASAKVMCKKDNESYKMEVTISDKGTLYRSEVVSNNMYDNIDLALPKVERQLYKHREKLKGKLRQDAFLPAEFLFEAESTPVKKEPVIARTKAFQLYPYTPGEAQERLDNLDLQFFMFINDVTKAVNVIYRRADGDYGLIEPIYDNE